MEWRVTHHGERRWFREDGRLSIAEVATIYADFVLTAFARRAEEAP